MRRRILYSMPCPIATIPQLFGEPGKGIHSFRVCGIAAVDVVLTMIAAAVVQKMISRVARVSYPVVLLLLFVCGIVAHRVFRVRTTVDKLLFGEPPRDNNN